MNTVLISRERNRKVPRWSSMSKRVKATVIGDGGWGTALALVLQRNGHEVTVWGYDRSIIDDIRNRRETHTLAPRVPLPHKTRSEWWNE